MASVSQKIRVLPAPSFTSRNGMLDRYFYFFMSLLIAAIVVWGFSHSINENLFHPAVPRPFLLWIHGGAFSGWVAFYILQSALVRTRNVKVHRLIGWFGAGLAATMVLLGVATGIIMGRFDKYIKHQTDADAFLSVPFGDMIVFAILVGLAVYWRKKPELHRRLLLIATCALLDAPFGRIDYINDHGLFYLCADAVALLAVGRDLLVDRRIHTVYRLALPPLWAFHALLIYLWLGAPAWWVKLGHSILG